MRGICLLSLAVCSNTLGDVFLKLLGESNFFWLCLDVVEFSTIFKNQDIQKILHVDVFTPKDGTDTLS